MNKRRRQPFLFALVCLLSFGGSGLLGSCRHQERTLKLADLTPGEHLYCQRIVALERAKTVALIDRQRGEALLDSLAAAWGDSVVPETLAGLSRDPDRSVAIGQLLLRIVTAEQDSMKRNPGDSRLGLPLPDPDRPARPRPGSRDKKHDGTVPRT